MIDERFLSSLRTMRVDDLDLRELAGALCDELALAEARLRACATEPRRATSAVYGVTTKTFDRAIVAVVS